MPKKAKVVVHPGSRIGKVEKRLFGSFLNLSGIGSTEAYIIRSIQPQMI